MSLSNKQRLERIEAVLRKSPAFIEWNRERWRQAREAWLDEPHLAKTTEQIRQRVQDEIDHHPALDFSCTLDPLDVYPVIFDNWEGDGHGS